MRRRISCWRVSWGICGILALAVPLPALAQSKASPQAGGATALPPDSTATNEPKTKEQLEAQQHFQRAKDLYQTGAYREAIAELESARLLDPKAKDLVFNLGIVHEKLGKFDEAITFFRQYMEMETVTTSERGKAENIIKRIEGAKREVKPVAPAATGTAEPTPPAPAPEVSRGRIDGATIGVGALAVVGLGLGATFGILAVANKPSSDFVTGRDGSYDDLKSKTDSAHTQAIISDVGFGVGIVAAAVTAYLYFGRTKEPAKRALAPSVVPVASGGVLLLGGAFQ
ncbi:MAG TPA: tetratricopeptide repeat protein [Labilithrix sp.]|nr:tetratricopeptide repeat protein [Labilithrix sp.]